MKLMKKPTKPSNTLTEIISLRLNFLPLLILLVVACNPATDKEVPNYLPVDIELQQTISLMDKELSCITRQVVDWIGVRYLVG